MSTDLDTRLRSLTDITPPSHAPLGTEELHQRATKRRQRSALLRAIPAALVVVVVLAGAVGLANRTATTDVVVGSPDDNQLPDAGISERDTQIIDFLESAAELRHQLDREMVLSATYASTNASRSRDELHDQWAATDVALSTYTERRAVVVPGSGSLASEELGLVEAIKQADNRLARLDTNRRSVESMQTDALGQIDPYANTSAALQYLAVGYLQSVEDPDVFRGVLSASNLGTLAMTKATVLATLTISVEIGYYATLLPKGADPIASKVALGPGGELAGCGDDAQAAGDACPTYDDAITRNVDGDKLEASFLSFATVDQKQRYRAADAGSELDQMVANAFEDGIGRNDLRGTVPGSVAIDPTDWQRLALQRIDRFAVVEQELYESIGTVAVVPPATTDGGGSSPGTPPRAVELEPAPGEGGVSSTTAVAPDPPTTSAPTEGTTVEEVTTGPTTTTGGP